MTELRVPDDLWDTSVMPEGVLVRWIAAPGDAVKAGEAVAEVRLEDSLHAICAPCDGRLAPLMDPNDIVEPGSLLGEVK